MHGILRVLMQSKVHGAISSMEMSDFDACSNEGSRFEHLHSANLLAGDVPARLPSEDSGCGKKQSAVSEDERGRNGIIGVTAEDKLGRLVRIECLCDVHQRHREHRLTLTEQCQDAALCWCFRTPIKGLVVDHLRSHSCSVSAHAGKSRPAAALDDGDFSP